MTLAELKKGESKTIQSFTDIPLSVKLMEMGCLPGEQVRVEMVAPMGDPIAVNISGYTLSLRKDEASTIIVE